jgi:tRNA (guanine10-N2)-dimethyltransferase
LISRTVDRSVKNGRLMADPKRPSTVYLLELGGEDDAFAAREAASAATGLRRIAPGLAVAGGILPERVRGLAYTHRASELLGRGDADLASARAVLEAASLDREGSVAVRATDVHGSSGVRTDRVERELGQVLVDRGFSVDLDDPDHLLRAVFSKGVFEADSGGTVLEHVGGVESDGRDEPTGERVSVCALGWLAAESVRDFGTRAPTDKPFFQPGSMDPLLARAVANLAGARAGATVLDPMCGTGGVLVEAGLVGADVIGTDAQAKMARGARENLRHFLERDKPSPTGVSRGTRCGFRWPTIPSTASSSTRPTAASRRSTRIGSRTSSRVRSQRLTGWRRGQS